MHRSSGTFGGKAQNAQSSALRAAPAGMAFCRTSSIETAGDVGRHRIDRAVTSATVSP